MRTKTIREWTYAEVKEALAKVYGPITGIRLSQNSGYLAEECQPSEEPTSAKEEPNEPTPNP